MLILLAITQTTYYSYLYLESGNFDYISRWVWLSINHISSYITHQHLLMSLMNCLNILNTNSWVFGLINILYFGVHFHYLKIQYNLGTIYRNGFMVELKKHIMKKIRYYLQVNNSRSSDGDMHGMHDMHDILEIITYLQVHLFNDKTKSCIENSIVEIVKSIVCKLKEDEELNENLKLLSNRVVEHGIEQREKIVQHVKHEFENIITNDEKKEQFRKYISDKTRYIVDETNLVDIMVDPLIKRVKERIKQML